MDTEQALLDGIASAVATVGTRGFDAALLDAVAAAAAVDHLTILTYRGSEGIRALGIASRVSLSVARSLTRDYVATHHVLDPNFPDVTGGGGRRRVLVRRHDPRRLKGRAYQDRFYTTVGIVDKVAFIWHVADTGYYVNFYRTQRSGRYSCADVAALTALTRVVAALVRLHGARMAVRSAGSGAELAADVVGLLSDRLTRRETAVVTGILKGMRTEGIAIELGIKAASVITFRKRAYAKLGIATQSELFACCLQALPGWRDGTTPPVDPSLMRPGATRPEPPPGSGRGSGRPPSRQS